MTRGHNNTGTACPGTPAPVGAQIMSCEYVSRRSIGWLASAGRWMSCSTNGRALYATHATQYKVALDVRVQRLSPSYRAPQPHLFRGRRSQIPSLRALRLRWMEEIYHPRSFQCAGKYPCARSGSFGKVGAPGKGNQTRGASQSAKCAADPLRLVGARLL